MTQLSEMSSETEVSLRAHFIQTLPLTLQDHS